MERGALREAAAALSEAARGRRLIFDSDTFTSDQVAYAAVVRALDAALPASLVVDYRGALGAVGNFGGMSGLVDLDLPRDHVEAASAILTELRPAATREFWRWKARQPAQRFAARLVLSSWADAVAAEDLCFGEAPAHAVSVGESCWQRWTSNYARLGCSFALTLPRPDGALLLLIFTGPQAGAAAQGGRWTVQREHPGRMWHPPA
ncbi:unnamed protein product [Prorocentrum cordatum]|uniref:Uncharacterized protein n=1 Tax=Prorocentrum cordatum TaxID=2364126 RepID=A0ABN9YH62_9DINO|nr:unnamed protein product [Polarella glacialis]